MEKSQKGQKRGAVFVSRLQRPTKLEGDQQLPVSLIFSIHLHILTHLAKQSFFFVQFSRCRLNRTINRFQFRSQPRNPSVTTPGRKPRSLRMSVVNSVNFLLPRPKSWRRNQPSQKPEMPFDLNHLTTMETIEEPRLKRRRLPNHPRRGRMLQSQTTTLRRTSRPVLLEGS